MAHSHSRGCNSDECGWTGTTRRMLGSIGPLCPRCGETTELLTPPTEDARRPMRSPHFGSNYGPSASYTPASDNHDSAGYEVPDRSSAYPEE